MVLSAAARVSPVKRRRTIGCDPKSATELDVYVGQRVRLRRTMLDFGQDELAEAVGVTYQQIQKYERGETRLTIGRLFDIGLVLGVTIDWFLDGLDGSIAPVQYKAERQHDRETYEMIRLFSSVTNPKLRRRFLGLARALVEDGSKIDPTSRTSI